MELMLGVRNEVPVSRFEVTSERFGIPAGKPEIVAADVILQIDPQPRSGLLRISTIEGEGHAAAAKIFEAFLPGCPAPRFQMHIVSGCFEFLLKDDGTSHGRLFLDLDERVPIENIVQYTSVLSWRSKGPLELALTLDDQRQSLGHFTLDSDCYPPAWAEIGFAARAIEILVSTATRSHVELAVREMQRASPDLQLLSILAGDRSIRLKFPEENGAPVKFDGMLAYTAADVGMWAVAALVYKPVETETLVDGQRQLTFRRAQIVEALVEKGCSVDYLPKVREWYKERLGRLTGEVIAGDDFREFVRGIVGET